MGTRRTLGAGGGLSEPAGPMVTSVAPAGETETRLRAPERSSELDEPDQRSESRDELPTDSEGERRPEPDADT